MDGFFAIRYSIYTEYKNIKKVRQVLDSLCGSVGYTLTKCEGRWKSKSEQALKIEIIRQANLETLIRSIVTEVKRLNNQEAVLVTTEPLTGEIFL